MSRTLHAHDKQARIEGAPIMAGQLQGAYVQAWVWIDLEPGDEEPSDEQIRHLAMDNHAREGEIEIDENATVSRSYLGS